MIFNYLATLSTLQLLLIIGGGIAFIFLVKVILTPGGPRGRMKRSASPWIMVPLVIAIIGGVIWVAVKMISTGGHIA